MEKLIAANAGALDPALARPSSMTLKNRYSIDFWFMLVAEYHSVCATDLLIKWPLDLNKPKPSIPRNGCPRVMRLALAAYPGRPSGNW